MAPEIHICLLKLSAGPPQLFSFKTKGLNIILYHGKLGENIFMKVCGDGLAIKYGLFGI